MVPKDIKFELIHHKSDWWSNMGNQRISGWTIRSYDSFRIGDFDNDGFDELLCLQFGGYWATVLHFDSGFPV